MYGLGVEHAPSVLWYPHSGDLFQLGVIIVKEGLAIAGILHSIEHSVDIGPTGLYGVQQIIVPYPVDVSTYHGFGPVGVRLHCADVGPVLGDVPGHPILEIIRGVPALVQAAGHRLVIDLYLAARALFEIGSIDVLVAVVQHGSYEVLWYLGQLWQQHELLMHD